MRTLIQNVHVLTMDQTYTEYPNGFVLMNGNTIEAVGASGTPITVQVDKTIDGRGAIAMPGMVNTHTHIGMIPFRSLGDDTPDRLTRFLFPLEKACMTRSLAYHSGKYAIAEMQLAGITTFMDLYYFESDLARAADEMGARAILSETVLEDACDSPVPFGGLEYAERFIPEWLNHERITPAIAPHAPYTNTTESLQQARKIADHYGVPLTIHVSEMDFEMKKYEKEYQQTPIAYLAACGILNSNTVAAHCIFATPDDIALLAQHDVAVAHCIGANTKSAKGIAPIQAMQEAGLRIGLGTDGPSSGNTLDLFTQMRMVANFHKTQLKDRSAFPAREIVRLATMGGAEALGMAETIGSLEPGKKADLLLIETESVNMFPLFDPYATIVYSAQAANVQAVWIDGQPVVQEKSLVKIPLATLRQNLSSEMTDFRATASTFSK
ncbi:amidohydrolase [Jeotgalibaca caeni]|uniref:amidohydrolase n=1 Tax=Jeotgalibaca caeni TaxID=3028623 RepID=UPI00237E5769|nr:amidohydrolase [Jeotgalibaca caeni]MDE1549147.1 amidohydrolase [Jeotgalibaca caeni]